MGILCEGVKSPNSSFLFKVSALRGNTLNTICKKFGLKKDSSAGSIVDRVKTQILKDKQLRKKVAEINKTISKR